MGLYSFVLSACNGKFDARHVMVAGCCVFTAFSFSIPQATKARLSNNVTNEVAAAIVSDMEIPLVSLPAVKPADFYVASITVKAKPAVAIAKNAKFTLFNAHPTDEKSRLTHLASLGEKAEITQFSAKDKEACSVNAAKAAANGDTSKISPCLEALLSGDDSKMAEMPRKMADFFIEAMNDPDRNENAPKNMINSMMAMMEALTTKTDTDQPVTTPVSISD